MYILKIIVLALFSTISVAQAQEVRKLEVPRTPGEVMEATKILYDLSRTSCASDRKQWTEKNHGGSIEGADFPACDAYKEIEVNYWDSVRDYQHSILNSRRS
jgi:hypothetical protein